MLEAIGTSTEARGAERQYNTRTTQNRMKSDVRRVPRERAYGVWRMAAQELRLNTRMDDSPGGRRKKR